MPINKVFELGRRAVKKRTRCFAGERIGNEGEEGKGGIIIPKDNFKEFVGFQKVVGGSEIMEIKGSSRGMYIRITSDILPKWKDIRNSDIPPN